MVTLTDSCIVLDYGTIVFICKYDCYPSYFPCSKLPAQAQIKRWTCHKAAALTLTIKADLPQFIQVDRLSLQQIIKLF